MEELGLFSYKVFELYIQEYSVIWRSSFERVNFKFILWTLEKLLKHKTKMKRKQTPQELLTCMLRDNALLFNKTTFFSLQKLN